MRSSFLQVEEEIPEEETIESQSLLNEVKFPTYRLEFYNPL